MKRCAVVIGVNKTGGMTVLSAAVTGARQFADWAESQGYDIALHTDDEQVVRCGDILNSVRSFVDQRNYHLMVVFFAGHGILRSPGDEFWLLSEAPYNPNEAVSVSASKLIAKNSGIPHVVFISDACRSIPSDMSVMEIHGQVIFPNARSQGKCDIDMFYATRAGNPSYEIKDTIAVKNYKGIYTDCLLKALHGNVPEVVSEVTAESESFPAVLCYELGNYLEAIVPQVASEFDITLSQDPVAEVTSRTPKYIARVPAISDTKVFKNMDRFESLKAGPKARKSQELRNVRNSDDLKNSYDAILNARGRESFETGTGFTIVGEARVFDLRKNIELFNERDALQVRVQGGSAENTLLILTGNNRFTPVAILPGFIGTIVIKDGRVINVNYFPSRFTPRYDLAMNRMDEVSARRARIAAAAQFGKYDIQDNVDSVIAAASYLRNDKAFDPTLGLYASYAYAQAGYEDGMRSVFEYMNREAEPVLFDVAMLAKISGEALEMHMHTAPFCPLLTQGWSFIGLMETEDAETLREYERYLVPGLWTTLNEKGMEKLLNDSRLNKNLI